MATSLDKVKSAPTTGKGKKSTVRDVDPKDAVVGGVVEGNKEEVKVRDAVTKFVKFSALEKSYKAQMGEMSNLIRTYAGNIRTENADHGDYHKSYRILGGTSKDKLQYAATCSSMDRFSIPKDELVMDTVKDMIGEEMFEKIFSKEVVISIRNDVLNNAEKKKKLTKKLVEAFGKELSEWFEKDEIWTTNSDADKAIYELEADTRTDFLNIVPQYKDSVKDSSNISK